MTERFRLFLVWFISFAVAILTIIGLWLSDRILEENLQSSIGAIVGIYVPYLTPVVTFWFAKDVLSGERGTNRPAYIVAMLCSILFNAVEEVILLSLFFREGEGLLDTTLKNAAGIGTLLAFLVGPAIGYYFANAHTAAAPAQADPAKPSPAPPPTPGS